MIAAMEKYNIDIIKWVRLEGDLDFFFGEGGIDWVGHGFSIPLIREAVKAGFQWTNDNDDLVSLFPISDEITFNTAFGPFLENYPIMCRCVTEEEAVAERDAHKAAADAAAEEAANTPSQEDIYKAQQLLLLTEISNKLGDSNG